MLDPAVSRASLLRPLLREASSASAGPRTAAGWLLVAVALLALRLPGRGGRPVLGSIWPRPDNPRLEPRGISRRASATGDRLEFTGGVPWIGTQVSGRAAAAASRSATQPPDARPRAEQSWVHYGPDADHRQRDSGESEVLGARGVERKRRHGSSSFNPSRAGPAHRRGVLLRPHDAAPGQARRALRPTGRSACSRAASFPRASTAGFVAFFGPGLAANPLDRGVSPRARNERAAVRPRGRAGARRTLALRRLTYHGADEDRPPRLPRCSWAPAHLRKRRRTRARSTIQKAVELFQKALAAQTQGGGAARHPRLPGQPRGHHPRDGSEDEGAHAALGEVVQYYRDRGADRPLFRRHLIDKIGGNETIQGYDGERYWQKLGNTARARAPRARVEGRRRPRSRAR